MSLNFAPDYTDDGLLGDLLSYGTGGLFQFDAPIPPVPIPTRRIFVVRGSDRVFPVARCC